MLKQLHFQVPRPKKRKLYTPLSLEGEEDAENRVPNEIFLNLINDVENQVLKCPIAVQKELNYSISLNEKKAHKYCEAAERSFWKTHKPIFRKEAVVIKSIFKCRVCIFSKVEIANIRAIYHDENVEKIAENQDLCMNIPTSIKASCDLINTSIVDSRESNDSKEHRQYSITEILQPSNIINSRRPTIKCIALNNIFAQHEKTRIQKEIQMNIEKIDSSFICSQLFDKSILNSSSRTENDYGNETKSLFDSKTVLNEWLNDDSNSTCDNGPNSTSSLLLSDISKKIRLFGYLDNCFL